MTIFLEDLDCNFKMHYAITVPRHCLITAIHSATLGVLAVVPKLPNRPHDLPIVAQLSLHLHDFGCEDFFLIFG